MSINQETFEQVKAYYRGAMQGAERGAFEKKIQSDEAFAKEVTGYGLLLDTIQAYGDQQLEKELKKTGKVLLAQSAPSTQSAPPETAAPKSGRVIGFRPVYLVALAAAVVLLIAVFLPRFTSQPATSEELYSEYFTMPDPSGVREGGGDQQWVDAVQAFQQRDYPSAIEKLQMVMMDSSFVLKSEAWLYLGISHMAENHPREALEALSQVSDTSEHIDLARWYEGLTYLYLGDLNAARMNFLAIASDSLHEKQLAAEELLAKLESIL